MSKLTHLKAWLPLPDSTKLNIYRETGRKIGLSAVAIEKDWWVVHTLSIIFSMACAPSLVFKGGTSLSKGWNLIQRFSEDIDIALDPLAFGKEYKTNPSHTYIKTLKKDGCAFTSTILTDALKAQFIHLGIPMENIIIEAEAVHDTIPDKDPPGAGRCN